MKTFQAELAIDIQTNLGEGPLWNEEHQKLYFVDIVDKKLYSFDEENQELKNWEFDTYTSAVAKYKNDELLICEQHQLLKINIKTNEITPLLQLDLAENIRTNEAKPDASGNFWIGTMDIEAKEKQGAFYFVSKNGKVKKVLNNLSVPNGFCWSLDNQYLYHVDSFDYAVKQFTFNRKTQSLSKGEVLFDLKKYLALPDVVCMDSLGRLWIALWGGFKVICFNPLTRKVEAIVLVDAPNVTSCIFGGKNLETLYITTASYGMSENELQQHPKSGAVFSCKIDVKGLLSNTAQLSI